jgi:molybdopterin/thiamine biosynthesis adenylyltransferase
MASKSSSSSTVRDYSRLEATAFRRDRTTRLRIVVVGAGALGNEVIKNLALLGVGSLCIVDRDRIEASNLTRSILFCTSEAEHHLAQKTPKAELAAKSVQEINPEVNVESFAGEIADFGLGRLRRSDLVFSCLDNELARLELSWACNRLNKPLVDGGLGLINSSSGLVSLLPGSNGPCYACRKGAKRRGELLQELFGRDDPCWIEDRRREDAGFVSTTPLMASLIGALQAEIGLRHCFEDDQACSKGRSYRLETYPQPDLELLEFERSPNCPLHQAESYIQQLIEITEHASTEWTPAELFRELGEPDCYMSFDWPRTLRACCQDCHFEWQPMMRRARFLTSACPRCGSRNLVELEVLKGLPADSPWADCTFAHLGFPAGNIYEIAIGNGPNVRRVHVELTKDLGLTHNTGG